LGEVETNFRTGYAVRFARDLHKDGVVDKPIEEIGLDDHRGTKLAARAVAVRPVHEHDVAAVHVVFRYFS
jgi:hypothetical protein